MQNLKIRSRGSSVSFLQELLVKVGYDVPITQYFGSMTEAAVKDFQSKNRLVIDGEVGLKTWTVLLEKTKPAQALQDKFLEENDLIDFSKKYGVELAAIKAVNEVESSGKGFFVDGRPKILFEGHIFWRQLKEREIDPAPLSKSGNEDVLYRSWTKTHYLGGTKEYSRLEKAMALGTDPRIKEAALASASWGSYQIMGFHALKLGYATVQAFVDEMYIHESNQLDAFGKYIATFSCLVHLKNKDWAKFAKCYNGPGYAKNKYDIKMAKAYEKYST
jgi:hypothetical protein